MKATRWATPWTFGLGLDFVEGGYGSWRTNEAGEGRDWGMDTGGPVLSGAVPATGFLRQSSVNLDSRGFIPVNKVGPGGVGRVLTVGGGRIRPRPLSHP